MVTKFIGIRKLKAINHRKLAIEKLCVELKEAEKDIHDGKFYTQEDVMKEFGIL